jgi:hypothetical protein
MHPALLLSVPVALGLRVLVGNILFPFFLKKVVMRDRRIDQFFMQYCFALGLAITLTFFWGGIQFDSTFLPLVALGFITAGGNYFAWGAVAISQSRTSVFTFWDDLIAVSLAYFILHEGRFISPTIAVGIGLSFLSIILFARHGWIHCLRKKEQGQTVSFKFYVYVLVYSVLWGFSQFGQRFWSFHEMPTQTFLLGFYTGTFVMAALIRAFYNDRMEGTPQKSLIFRDFAYSFTLAVLIFVSMGLAFAAYRAPQVIVQPVLLVAEMVFPTLIGLFIFHERKQLDPPEWIYLGIGFAGALLVGRSLI